MSILPNTVCSRCHREYPSIRSRCPYCGTKKPREVRRTIPESDSAVRGTEAARHAAENMNWQMLIGGILLVCVLAAVIAIVSVNMNSRIDSDASIPAASMPEIEAETTAIPVPTATPTPTPSPTPGITSISITWWGQALPNGFMDYAGSQYQLEATPYPLTDDVVVEWSSTDESCATVDQNGLVTIVGGWGTSCEIVATAGGFSASVPVWGK